MDEEMEHHNEKRTHSGCAYCQACATALPQWLPVNEASTVQTRAEKAGQSPEDIV